MRRRKELMREANFWSCKRERRGRGREGEKFFSPSCSHARPREKREASKRELLHEGFTHDGNVFRHASEEGGKKRTKEKFFGPLSLTREDYREKDLGERDVDGWRVWWWKMLMCAREKERGKREEEMMAKGKEGEKKRKKFPSAQRKFHSRRARESGRERWSERKEKGERRRGGEGGEKEKRRGGRRVARLLAI